MKAPEGYEILGTLGTGAMGVVYHATQAGLGREVALKCIRANDQASPAFLARFRREAEALAKVSHPNLVKLYDVGTDGEMPYIAMELVKGRPLEALLRDQPVEVRRREKDLFRAILDAVCALHDAGLAHRDLKPLNIMVGPDWRPVVMDLGLVKDLAGDGATLTRTGVLLGTPQYLAPEVLAGAPAGLTADCWALGCIYYALNAGCAPFRATTLAELYHAIANGPLPDLEVACPDLPPARRAFLLQLMDRDPKRRPQTARAALARLRDSVGKSRTTPQLATAPRALPVRAVSIAAALALMGAGAFVWTRRAPVDLVARATPVGPPPSTPAEPAVDRQADERLRASILERLGGRDRHAMDALIEDLRNVPGVPRPRPATGASRGTERPVPSPEERPPVLAAQRKRVRSWMMSGFGVDLDRLVEAVPRWMADPELGDDVRFRVYRAVTALSSLDATSEYTVGAPLVDTDALVAPYVRMRRGGPAPAGGYRPLDALRAGPVPEMRKSSHLVLFALITAEAGLFPESWWDAAQAAVAPLEVPGSRAQGLTWYDLGTLPQGTIGAGAHEVTLRVTDLDPGMRAWLRFGKNRTVCFRNTRELTTRGVKGVELPPKNVLEQRAVTLTAVVPPGFLIAGDRGLEVGCDSIPLEAAYNLRYFWLVDVIIKQVRQ